MLQFEKHCAVCYYGIEATYQEGGVTFLKAATSNRNDICRWISSSMLRAREVLVRMIKECGSAKHVDGMKRPRLHPSRCPRCLGMSDLKLHVLSELVLLPLFVPFQGREPLEELVRCVLAAKDRAEIRDVEAMRLQHGILVVPVSRMFAMEYNA